MAGKPIRINLMRRPCASDANSVPNSPRFSASIRSLTVKPSRRSLLSEPRSDTCRSSRTVSWTPAWIAACRAGRPRQTVHTPALCFPARHARSCFFPEGPQGGKTHANFRASLPTFSRDPAFIGRKILSFAHDDRSLDKACSGSLEYFRALAAAGLDGLSPPCVRCAGLRTHVRRIRHANNFLAMIEVFPAAERSNPEKEIWPGCQRMALQLGLSLA